MFARDNILSLSYKLQITFSQTEINFKITHRGSGTQKEFKIIKYVNNSAYMQRRDFTKKLHIAEKMQHILPDMSLQRSGFSREMYRHLEHLMHLLKKKVVTHKNMNIRFKDFFGDILFGEPTAQSTL